MRNEENEKVEMLASVIIPAFNAEKTIARALDSLLEEAPDFPYEVIVVDDSSADGTAEILREYGEKYPVLRGFTIPNAGPAGARNFGIEKARGKYILFCDSDDYFFPGALDKAVREMERDGSDFLVFGFSIVDEEHSFPYFCEGMRGIPRAEMKHALPLLYGANMLNQVWGKVFRADFLKENGIAFPPKMIYGEDRLFVFQVLEKAESVTVLEDCLYAYTQQKSGLTSRFIPEKFEICTTIDRGVRALAESFGDVTEEGTRLFNYMYIKSVLSCFSPLFAPSCPLRHREKRAYIKTILTAPSVKGRFFFPKDCGRSFRFFASVMKGGSVSLNHFASFGMYFAAKHFPGLFRRAKHAYNR